MSNDSVKKVTENKRTVRCPRCGQSALFSSENPFRPFCSERCRLIDLGQWADETYRVPINDSSSSTLSDDSEENE